jgi:nucleotide-binding universal stress UspA family protein
MIVATDGREQSDATLRAGALLAAGSDAWWILTVASPFPIIAPEIDLQFSADAIAAHREAQVQSVKKQLAQLLGARDVRVETLDGHPADVIARAAAQANASLVVAGLGRHRMIDRVLGDETVLRLVRSTPCPVLAVGDEFAIPRTIVVGIDFSENSVHAAQLALCFIERGGSLHLMNVAPREDLLGLLAGGPATYHEHAMARIGELVAQLDVPPGVDIQSVVRSGDPGTRILEYAGDARAGMIAIGARGHGRTARMLVGSVASKILRGSAIAVLTLPE